MENGYPLVPQFDISVYLVSFNNLLDKNIKQNNDQQKKL